MIFGIRDPKSSRSSTPFTFALLFGQRFSIPLRAGDQLYWGTRTSVMPFSDMLKSLMLTFILGTATTT